MRGRHVGEPPPEDETPEQTIARLQRIIDTEPKPPRSVVVIAALGLVGITSTAVGGLVWAVVVKGSSTDTLSTISAVGIGAVAGIIGGRVTAPPPTSREKDVD